ncbi:hypothetical protein, partial [Geobacillus stearothermophilus]|uniref:hypothetical protein n=1 Tax=Geobacillus stearothermophilus TaxID=1422 RepID=UPI002E21B3ED|nr:hypothetical protein [Geobacillus stearothermophilus]
FFKIFWNTDSLVVIFSLFGKTDQTKEINDFRIALYLSCISVFSGTAKEKRSPKRSAFSPASK